MKVVIDIGNTNIVVGIYKNKEWLTGRIETYPKRLPAFYESRIMDLFAKAHVSPKKVNQVVLSSVVPTLIPVFEILILSFFDKKPVVVGTQTFPKLKLQIDRPEEIGTDLVANAVAASEQFGNNCIIVDFGTALTFTVVRKRHILGVSIAPGIKTAINALATGTAQLPEVPLDIPQSAIGKNTIHAIQAGILYGYTGMVKHLLKVIREEIKEDFTVIATGGLSKVLHTLKDEFDYIDPHLTLDGLRIIGEYVKNV